MTYVAAAGLDVELRDLVIETTQTTGTNAYALDGVSEAGMRSFVNAVGNGNKTVYTVRAGSNREVGIGTVSAGAPATISREFILESSNNDLAVNWPGGIKTIYAVVPAALLGQIPGPGQVPWDSVSSGNNALGVQVPETITEYRDGMEVWWRKGNTDNTGNMTLDVNSIGAKPLLKAVSTQIPAGEAKADAIMGAVYVLAVDAWIVISGLSRDGALLNTKNVYTSSTTWTKPAGIRFVEIEMVGGGGAGGGCNSTTGTQNSNGGGGGGGEYARARIDAASLGSTETVTIGAGGTGSVGSSGGTGGTTSFGAHVTAAGGTGGSNGNASDGNAVADSGSGGNGGTGADVSIIGSDGGKGRVTGGEAHLSGDGGASHLSGGRSSAGLSGGGGAMNGYAYGGGGSGAVNAASQGSNRAGGDGAAGIMIVREYF